VPWRVFPTREDCISYFRSEVAAHLEGERAGKGREQAWRQSIALLSGMFFEEPELSGPGTSAASAGGARHGL